MHHMDSPPASSGTPPYRLLSPATAGPVLFTSPHSGRHYSAEFKAAARLDPHALRRSEDCFVDELFSDAPLYGAPLLAADFPRAWCDVNREAWELDPAMFDAPLPSWVNTTSPRIQVGLGTVARVVATGEAIYRRKLSFAEAEARIRSCWFPFHEKLGALIAAAKARHGCCLLIDCHSMPSSPSVEGADLIIGDAHGTTAAAAITRLVEEAWQSLGYKVRRNAPYAGGFITRHYGQPRQGVHAVQIEISRSLYVREGDIVKTQNFAVLHSDINSVLRRVTQADLADLMLSP